MAQKDVLNPIYKCYKETKMLQIHQDYLTDENGNKKAVVIPLTEWQKIIEELEDIKAYDKAKSVISEPVP